MHRPSLREQECQLRAAAKRRGMRVRKVRSLGEYRAMNPRAARELGVKCPRHLIKYTLSKKRPKHRMVYDVRHELLEYDKMRQGWSYARAHRFANKRQLDPQAVK